MHVVYSWCVGALIFKGAVWTVIVKVALQMIDLPIRMMETAVLQRNQITISPEGGTALTST